MMNTLTSLYRFEQKADGSLFWATALSPGARRSPSASRVAGPPSATTSGSGMGATWSGNAPPPPPATSRRYGGSSPKRFTATRGKPFLFGRSPTGQATGFSAYLPILPQIFQFVNRKFGKIFSQNIHCPKWGRHFTTLKR